MQPNLLEMTVAEALHTQYDTLFDTPYYFLTERVFPCVIQRKDLFIMNPEARHRDTGTGIAKYDAEVLHSRIDHGCTVEMMLNIFHEGSYLRILHEDDRALIYRVLSLHLQCCLAHNANTFTNLGKAVDIVSMDVMEKFLDSLFNASKFELNRPTEHDDARTRFNKALGGISPRREENNGWANAKRSPIIGEREMSDEYMSGVTNVGPGNLDGEDVFGFGNDDWT